MARPTKDLDDLIRQALEEEEQDTLRGLDAQSAAELLGETFRGKNSLFALGGAVANLILFVLGVFAAVKFGQADEVRVMLLWGGTAGLCFLAVTAIKIWYWLEMARLSVVREVKRTELQLIQLTRQLGDSNLS